MKHLCRCFVVLMVSACSSQPATPDQPVEEPDEKIEFTHQQGLTDTFSYRRLGWGATSEQIVERMQTEPQDTTEKNGVQLLTFTTSTQGVETSLTMGLVDGGLATIDIAPVAPQDCAEAVTKWTKALTIKYGTPSETTETFTVWKLADLSRIVIEVGERCSIVYARDAKTRVDVTNRLSR